MARSFLAEALGMLDDPAVIPHLERLLVDDAECVDMWAYWRVMDDAALSLMRWSDDSPAYDNWVEARLDELGGDGRRMAAVSLGRVRHRAAIAPLVEVAVEGDDWALGLLEGYRSREVAEALCEALERADDSTKSIIAQGLGKNGDPSCIPTLARMLEEGPRQIRRAAARGLRSLEHAEARRVLEVYRDDPDPDVRSEVALRRG